MSQRKLVKIILGVYALAFILMILSVMEPFVLLLLKSNFNVQIKPFANIMDSNPMGLVLPFICMIIGFVIWIIWGKDAPIVAPISFYPPNGYNSAEIGMLYKGKASEREVVSLLMYLADQGYWTIEEFQDNKWRASFKIVFQKNAYTGHNAVERLFFKGIYRLAKKDPKTGKKYVTAGEIAGKFSETTEKIIKVLNASSYYSDMYEPKKKVPCAVLIVMMVVLYVTGVLIPLYQYTEKFFIPVVITVITVVAVRVYKNMYKKDKGYFLYNLFAAIMCSSIVLILLGIMGIPAFVAANNMAGGLASVAAIFVLMITLALMSRRSKKGTQILGEIEGFKTFLTTAEKPRIEALVQENPEYYYNILPFTYVLNITLAGVDMLEDLAFGSPYWYHPAASDKNSLGSMTETMKMAEKSMCR